MEEVCHEVLFDAPEQPGKRFVLDLPTVRAKLKALDSVDLLDS
jgi:hypothetical protein